MKQVIKYILLLCLPLNAAAQQAFPVLTLDSILKRIDDNNMVLQSYALKAESYRHSADAAGSWMAPMAGIGTFMTPYPGEKAMAPAEKGNIMIQLEQEIPNPAKIKARKNYIRSKGNIVASGRAIALNELNSKAKKLYYQWMIAKERIGVLKENEKLMSTMKKIEEVRYPYNKSQLSGIYLVTAKLEENTNMIRMQEGNINKARAWIMTLMNADPKDTFDITMQIEPHFVPSDMNDTSVIAAVRKDITALDENVRSMQLNIKQLQTEKKPEFRIRFDHMSPLSGVMPKAFSVMGMVSIPIAPWSSGMYKSEIKAMEYTIKGMQQERSGMLQETKGQLLAMQAEIQSMHERVIAMEEKIIPALEKGLDASYLLYQENRQPINEVIDAWEALNMMRLNLLDEKLKHYEMIVDYEKELFQ